MTPSARVARVARCDLARALTVAVALLAGCGSAGSEGPCAARPNVGFRVVEYAAGLEAAVWYPTRAPALPFAYPGAMGLVGEIAENAPIASCGGGAPLVLFSHGDGGCGTQSIFVTEELARQGYVVAAPDHADALCSVDGGPHRGPDAPGTPPFSEPEEFTDQDYVGRRDDLEALAAFVLSASDFRAGIDAERFAVVGHSLGGYTAAGLAGGWESWRDSRFSAALLLSPYIQPYLVHDRFAAIELPLMYQSGTADLGILPFLEGPFGAYARSHAPKFLVVHRGAGHFDWTNTTCASFASVGECLSGNVVARSIVDYGSAFLDRYLRGSVSPLLDGDGTDLAEYRADPG